MVKGEPKWNDNKKAQRESATSKEKAEKAKRAAKKPDHRKSRNTRCLVMVRVGETEFPPKTADGKQSLPVDTEGEEELTAV